MPLATCPDCQQHVSDKAGFCPHCGLPFYKHEEPEMVQFMRKTRNLLRWMLTLHVITFVIFVLPVIVFLIVMISAGVARPSLMGIY
jgi:uncharacterized membrane protein YvbJ